MRIVWDVLLLRLYKRVFSFHFILYIINLTAKERKTAYVNTKNKPKVRTKVLYCMDERVIKEVLSK